MLDMNRVEDFIGSARELGEAVADHMAANQPQLPFVRLDKEALAVEIGNRIISASAAALQLAARQLRRDMPHEGEMSDRQPAAAE